MKAWTKRTAGLLTALLLFLAADAILLWMAGVPRLEDAVVKKEQVCLDLLKKYQENHDMVGWLQVEGTGIDYPVMRGKGYLYRDFSEEYDASGSLFVEDDWTEEDLCTLIYGHNMWMDGTMFHPLHRFAEEDFFRRNRTIRFYVIQDGARTAEKRTYEIMHCIRTSVDEWNFSGSRYICAAEELDAFAAECRDRAVQKRETEDRCGEMIVLSTCSYHVRGGKGRLLLTGRLIDRKEQTKID